MESEAPGHSRRRFSSSSLARDANRIGVGKRRSLGGSRLFFSTKSKSTGSVKLLWPEELGDWPEDRGTSRGGSRSFRCHQLLEIALVFFCLLASTRLELPLSTRCGALCAYAAIVGMHSGTSRCRPDLAKLGPTPFVILGVRGRPLAARAWQLLLGADSESLVCGACSLSSRRFRAVGPALCREFVLR